MLSFPRPPKELLILFVIQSVDLANSWNLAVSDPLPRVVVEGYIRACLLEKICRYHLASKCVLRAIRCSARRYAHINRNQLGTICRRTVAQLVIEKTASLNDSAFQKTAKTAVLRTLRRTISDKTIATPRTGRRTPVDRRTTSR